MTQIRERQRISAEEVDNELLDHLCNPKTDKIGMKERLLTEQEREHCMKIRRGKISLASGLHHDGMIHIYLDDEDSGLRIERDEDNVLVIHPGDTARWRIARLNPVW